MKIISGGQTGADRAALDAAIALGLEYGGAVPKGRLTEDGPLETKYTGMIELSVPSYPARTAKNVRDSDAVLIFTLGRTDRGTALTISLAAQYKKPYLHIDIKNKSETEVLQEVVQWLRSVRPKVLDVAGSRESTSQGIYKKVYSILMNSLRTRE